MSTQIELTNSGESTTRIRCECCSDDHPWAPGETCGHPATRRYTVSMYYAECTGEGCSPIAG